MPATANCTPTCCGCSPRGRGTPMPDHRCAGRSTMPPADSARRMPPTHNSSPSTPMRIRLDALNGAVSQSAWRTKPSWYLVTTDDRMIPPPAQRAMAERAGATVVEAAGSHAIYVSQPGAVAELIAEAARSSVRETTGAIC
jgi:pimeloyl-ACP methyl ester carboxylesterase